MPRQSFWDRWDRTRLRAFYNEAEMRSGLEWRTIDGERIPVPRPLEAPLKLSQRRLQCPKRCRAEDEIRSDFNRFDLICILSAFPVLVPY